MSAITSPAANSTGTSAWADSVADQINQMRTYITYTGAAEVTPGAGTATWVTMGNVTVPTWATRARCSISIKSAVASAAGVSMGPAIKIGTSTGVVQRITAPATGRQPTIGWNDLLTSVPTGSQSVTIPVTFVLGTFTATAPCLFNLNIDWMQ